MAEIENGAGIMFVDFRDRLTIGSKHDRMMFEQNWRDRQAGVRMIIRRIDLPAVRQRTPQKIDANGLAARVQGQNRAAEGNVAGLQRFFHCREQTARQ